MRMREEESECGSEDGSSHVGAVGCGGLELRGGGSGEDA